MKEFIKKIAVYLFGFFLALVVLDGIYTLIYSNSYVRNKIQFVLNSPPKHYDVIILGSSRAENHVIPEMFQKLGLSTYNLGISGGNLCENCLMLKTFFEKGNTTDKILFQLDLNFQSEAPAEGVKAFYLPYLPINKTVYTHYSENTNDLSVLKDVPFYRYCAFDSKIGFREIIMTLIHKENKTNSASGFDPLDGKLNGSKKYDLPVTVSHKNKYYDQIVTICKANKVKLIVFSAPFCSQVTNEFFFSKLKQKIPELHDYSKAIKEDSLFSSCGHMNKNGAEVFTKILIEDCIINEKQ